MMDDVVDSNDSPQFDLIKYFKEFVSVRRTRLSTLV